MTDYFSQVEFENFGPIKKSTLQLTRLHALIGPNDSGKSSTLRGLQLLTLAERGTEREPVKGLLLPKTSIVANLGSHELYFKNWGRHGWDLMRRQGGMAVATYVGVNNSLPTLYAQPRMLRLDPDKMRVSGQLIPDGEPLEFGNDGGYGLGAVLDGVFSRDVSNFVEIQNLLIQHFPTVAALRLFTHKNGKSVGVRLKDGTEVPAERISEGMLYFMAFAALKYLIPTPLLLVEEPENGLHPNRIKEVVAVLRGISKTTQVVIATHSPLVLNELMPEEVTVVSRDISAGTVFTPISKTPDFEARSKVFTLGELWLSFADGKQDRLELNPVGA